MNTVSHQYIERASGQVKTEKLFADRLVTGLFSDRREKPGRMFKALSSGRMSALLGLMSYDIPLGAKLSGVGTFSKSLGVNLEECVDPPETLDTARKVFERKIRYWETRPMPEKSGTVVSPADSRMLAGSFERESHLFLKEKFFHFEELFGLEKTEWHWIFEHGDYAVFRLTPDKYHYNHFHISGKVLDIYEIEGCYYPCNPGAVMSLAAPYSKNKRVVTVVDTDVPGGDGIGLTAIIEVAALMIGEIVQCYSEALYDEPQPVTPGMFVKKGQPKSLYRPGSSTDILVFQKGRVNFTEDILANLHRPGVQTRYFEGFNKPLVETEVALRSVIANAVSREEE